MIRDGFTEKSLLDGQVAIVTGGTVGIGRATCLALAEAGAFIVAVGRRRDRLEQTITELERQGKVKGHFGLTLDVRDEANMQEMVERTLAKFNRIDILITAAGILRGGAGSLRTMQQMSVSEWDEVIDTNLGGVFLSNRAVIPVMIQQHSGNIVNISSTSGRKGLAYDSAYCASKFGVIGLSEALAEEMCQYGVRVQVLLPGAIETGMWGQNGPLPPPKDILTPGRAADLIFQMVTLPEDTVLETPIVEPLKRHSGVGLIGRSVIESMKPAKGI